MKFTHRGSEHDLVEIVSKDGFFYMDGLEKPIIKRFAIISLCKYFDIEDIDYKFQQFKFSTDKKRLTNDNKPFVDRVEITILSCIITMEEVIKKTKTSEVERKRFIGEGEVSELNLEGISMQYPQAMAVKRARSRAVLQYLNIDAYGEDEASEFQKAAMRAFTASEIEKECKKIIFAEASGLSKELDPPLNQEDFKRLMLETLEIKGELKYSSLSIRDLCIVTGRLSDLKRVSKKE